MPAFTLSSVFLDEYRDRQPKWDIVGQITYARTYSRQKEDGTPEQFWETLQRVVEGVYSVQKKHCRQLNLPWSDAKAQKSAQEMFHRMWTFRFLPPGRGLEHMGAPSLEKVGGMCLYNCAVVTTKDLHVNFSGPFVTAADELMLGVGVGFDTLGAGEILIQRPAYSDSHLLAGVLTGGDAHSPNAEGWLDSREGWCETIRTTLDAHVGKGAIPNFDYFAIRPKGTPIKTFGGVSPGPDPLRECVESIQEILGRYVGTTLDSTGIVDVFNVIGKCVVSGGRRRSAELALGSSIDGEFLRLKDPKIHAKELDSHRWASNNSIAAHVGMDYAPFVEQLIQGGEPGFVWLDNCRNYSRMGKRPDYSDLDVVCTNPCGEIPLESRILSDGVESELCNLSEVYPANHDSYEDFKRTLKFAYLYNKTVTLIPTHNPHVNSVLMRNRRIGTALSGVVQAIYKHGRREFFKWCDDGYTYLKELDRIYSNWLAIPRSIKITTCKPSGSVSLLPSATPGVHYPHSEYYIRRIRFEDTSPLLSILECAGYHVEPDVAAPNTMVVSFPVHDSNCSRYKRDVSIWEQLELAAQMQEHWADNAISVTVTIKPEEFGDVKYALEYYETRLKSVSFLPLLLDEDEEKRIYKQLPYESISPYQYAQMVEGLLPIQLDSNSKVVKDRQDRFCEGDRCML